LICCNALSISPDILKQFDAVLEKKAVPFSIRADFDSRGASSILVHVLIPPDDCARGPGAPLENTLLSSGKSRRVDMIMQLMENL